MNTDHSVSNINSWGPNENVYLNGNFAPMPQENDSVVLPVTGTLPVELNGRILARVGPNPAYKPIDMTYYHWFDGDGMINAFYFEDGKVIYRNRFVDTKKHLLEKEANEALFGGIRSTAKTKLKGWIKIRFGLLNLMYLGLRRLFGQGPTSSQFGKISEVLNCANTNILKHDNKLLAFDEAGQPYQIEQTSLDTYGIYNFNGQLTGSSVAHPVEDPFTGEFITIGYSPYPPYASYYIFTKAGKRTHFAEIDLPYPAMIHSFGLTTNYTIFFNLPAVFEADFLGTKEPFRWQPNKKSRIGVMPRKGYSKDIKWFDIPTIWLFHTMNSYEEGDNIIIYPAVFPRLPLLNLGTENPSPPFDQEPGSSLVKWTLNIVSGEFREELINPHMIEFPSMDPRFFTRKQKHGYCAALYDDIQLHGLWNTVCHYDFVSNTEDFYYCGKNKYVGEPVFTPRSSNADEGDGFLLAVMFDRDINKSSLLIFDAMKVKDGPVAVARLEKRIEYDFHGNVVIM